MKGEVGRRGGERGRRQVQLGARRAVGPGTLTMRRLGRRSRERDGAAGAARRIGEELGGQVGEAHVHVDRAVGLAVVLACAAEPGRRTEARVGDLAAAIRERELHLAGGAADRHGELRRAGADEEGRGGVLVDGGMRYAWRMSTVRGESESG